MAMSVRYQSVDGEILYQSGVDGRIDYLPDALGSVLATTKPNQPGVIDNTYRYKPYGGLLDKSGTGIDSKYLWVGTKTYRDTGLSHSSHYMIARHYAEQEGRWTTVDPLWPSEHSYGYVRNRPGKYSDHTGLQAGIPPLPIFGGQGKPLDVPIPGTCHRVRLCIPPHFCSRPGVDPCRFIPKPPPNQGEEVWGQPACCDGKVIPCSWLPPDGEQDNIVRGCTRAHEQVHINENDYTCPPCGASNATNTNPGAGGPTGECRASIQGLACYALSCAASALTGGDSYALCLTKRKRFLCNECAYAQLNCRQGRYQPFVPPTAIELCKRFCGISIT